tara:strand:- start:592 stop:1437 length:846 start_codon:yes stop_codon:yes gene_type:complete
MPILLLHAAAGKYQDVLFSYEVILRADGSIDPLTPLGFESIKRGIADMVKEPRASERDTQLTIHHLMFEKSAKFKSAMERRSDSLRLKLSVELGLFQVASLDIFDVLDWEGDEHVTLAYTTRKAVDVGAPSCHCSPPTATAPTATDHLHTCHTLRQCFFGPLVAAETLGIAAYQVPFTKRDAKRPRHLQPLQSAVVEIQDTEEGREHHFAYTVRTRTLWLDLGISVHTDGLHHFGTSPGEAPEIGDDGVPYVYVPGEGWIKSGEEDPNWMAALNPEDPFPF